MHTTVKISAYDSSSIFDSLRKFSPIKYQQGGIGQEQGIEPVPPDRIYTLGEFAQGGVVIWLTDDKKHGLVASIVNLQDNDSNLYALQWASVRIQTHATANDPLPTYYKNPIPKENYSGYQNQKTIENLDPNLSNYPAFQAAKEYSITIDNITYNDWFLPTSTELAQLYVQRNDVNKTSLANRGQALFSQRNDPGEGFYWSSREFAGSSAVAWSLGFSGAGQINPTLSNCICKTLIINSEQFEHLVHRFSLQSSQNSEEFVL